MGECYCGGVTRGWGRATHRLMINYVTVFPYCYKLHSLHFMCNLRVRTARTTLTHGRCRASSGPCRLNLTQAAGGWRSCAEGVPTGQSAASASSVLSSEKHRKDSKFIPPVPLLPFMSSSSEYAPLVDNLHRFTHTYHLTESNKWWTKCTLRYWTALTKAAEHKLLIVKLGRKKFQRSSKAHES